jgi:hypothetical protein
MEDAIRYAKPEEKRKVVLYKIEWDDPHDHFVLDDPKHYRWYEQKEVLLNDGCEFKVLDV